MSNKEHVATCSFCRKSKEEVGELAMGPGVSICIECLEFIKSHSTASLNSLTSRCAAEPRSYHIAGGIPAE
ncbi:ClpX C4-type zinc finger protein [Bacillus canaveralius]|uniref:ClpX C4-type zinc finger protein n=1 Tax=Bacillus canaveralius TaxID=1403243 RepID=UPI0028A22682|nr:ClpX C4-type zinc finger protein [Bacillus canaveralius]